MTILFHPLKLDFHGQNALVRLKFRIISGSGKGQFFEQDELRMALHLYSALCFSTVQRKDERKVFSDIAGKQEISPYEFACCISHLLHDIPVMKQKSDSVRCPFRSVDEKTCVVVDHLKLDAADISSDDRLPFPKAFSYR